MRQVQDYYENLAQSYDQERFANSYGQYVDRMERRLLARWLQYRAPEDIVELGCGTGRFLNFAKTGVDSSAAMLTEASKKWPDRALSHADAGNTGLAAQGFDVALCFHVLMHLDLAVCQTIFDEAARIVKPGGSFIFDIPSGPRRKLSGRRASGWHGNTSASLAEIRAWAGASWRLKRWRGVLFVPIHYVPSNWRKRFALLDMLIGATPLARWSSYYVCELERLDQPDGE
ncbi:MAG TPA: class I SAM-dependent methyltransferase [Gammaproteobacteria bacterium]